MPSWSPRPTPYAALKLPKSSVGPKQLKKNAVRSKKVKGGALLLSQEVAAIAAARATGRPGPRGNGRVRGAPPAGSGCSNETAAPASQVANEDVTLSNLPPGTT